MKEIGRMAVPAVAGGIMIAVFALIPFVNYLCCLYVPFGGFASAALLKMLGNGEKMKSGDGMKAGALAGVVAAVIYALVAVVILALITGVQVGLGAFASAASQTLDPLLAFGAMGLVQALVMGAIMIGFVAFYLLFYVSFGAIGGAIGESLLYKKE